MSTYFHLTAHPQIIFLLNICISCAESLCLILFLCTVKPELTILYLMLLQQFLRADVILTQRFFLILSASHTFAEAVGMFSLGSQEPPMSAKSLNEHTKTLFLHWCDLMSFSIEVEKSTECTGQRTKCSRRSGSFGEKLSL